MKLKVKEDHRLVRDTSNFAILNTDREVLSLHEQKLQRLQRERMREEEINSLRRDVTEIKELLAQLIKQRQ